MRKRIAEDMIKVYVMTLVMLIMIKVVIIMCDPVVDVHARNNHIYYNSEDPKENRTELVVEYKHPNFLQAFKENLVIVGKDTAGIAEADGMEIVGKSGGEAKIKILAPGYKDTLKLTVYGKLEDIDVKDVTLSVLNPEQEAAFKPVPSDAEPQKYSVTVEDESVATVKGNKLCMKKAGETTYTVTSGKIKASGKLKVLSSPTSLQAKDITLEPGKSEKIAVAMDVCDIGNTLTYESGDTKIAKVDKDGVVTAVSGGTTAITVKNDCGLETKCRVDVYPLHYADSTGDITITKEWYGNAWCYIAHLQFSDYSRFGTYCANNTYGSTSTVSEAANQLSSVLCINGCYSAPHLDYGVKRSGVVMNDKACTVPGVYSRQTGRFTSPEAAGVYGSYLSATGISDTFCFGPAFLVNGSVTANGDASRAQRTFVGTNGNPGDIWLVVSDGRNEVSPGLTHRECAQLLASKGCTFGIPLDGGGSSEMVFQGKILNPVKEERDYLVDFVYFK